MDKKKARTCTLGVEARALSSSVLKFVHRPSGPEGPGVMLFFRAITAHARRP
ncbi:MAG: hypothetical protein H3C30_19160 [Candidatus Hydrogenedentes bacterium]|nr:hypothetical protein [Candidatus Hydrogenedentota bacterium]